MNPAVQQGQCLEFVNDESSLKVHVGRLPVPQCHLLHFIVKGCALSFSRSPMILQELSSEESL